MNLQVLVSTMNQTDHSLLEKMRIQSDAIVVNQCDRNEFEEFEYNGHSVRFLSFAERGVGLSRNSALMRATADICLFADDDMIYVDNYDGLILEEFEKRRDADLIIFNVINEKSENKNHMIKKDKKARVYNSLKYGTYQLCVRTYAIKLNNIHFSLLFGGGAKYGCGEDTIFLNECFRKKLKIYRSTKIIGSNLKGESTWFKGYKDKYFIDRGALCASLSNRWAKFLCLQFCIRHRKMFEKDKKPIEAYRLMLQGIDEIIKS